MSLAKEMFGFVADDLSGFWKRTNDQEIGMRPEVRMASYLDALTRYGQGRLSCVGAAEFLGDQRAALFAGCTIVMKPRGGSFELAYE